MEQEATRPQQQAGGTKRVGDSPGATASSATPDSAQHKDKLPRDVPGAGKGVGNPRPTIRILNAPTAASLTNLPGGGVNLTSAAQAGATALHAAGFPPLKRATQSGKSKATTELESGTDDENELSDSVASSTGLSKVSKPTAHIATKSSHRNMQAGEPARVGVMVSVGTEGISIPGIYIPNRPVIEPERPPTGHRSWRVAQNIRRCRLILLCSQPQAMNSAALKTIKETHKDGAGAPKPGPRRATEGDTTQPVALSHENLGNKMNQPNQQGIERSKEETVFVKLTQPDSGAQWEISQDAITTCVQTELRALESDDRMASCRIQS